MPRSHQESKTYSSLRVKYIVSRSIVLLLVLLVLRITYHIFYGICHEPTRLDFIHIPKTGGSAVVHAGIRGLGALWGTGLWMWCGNVKGWEEHITFSLYQKLKQTHGVSYAEMPPLHPTKDRVWHIPPQFLANGGKGNTRGPNTATFCVIRDPLKRLLSQYRFAMQNLEKNYKYDGRSEERTVLFRWQGGSTLQWSVHANCPINRKTKICGVAAMNCFLRAWLLAFKTNPAVFFWHLAPQAWYVQYSKSTELPLALEGSNNATGIPKTDSIGRILTSNDAIKHRKNENGDFVSTCDHTLVHGPTLAEDFAMLTKHYDLALQLPPVPENRVSNVRSRDLKKLLQLKEGSLQGSSSQNRSSTTTSIATGSSSYSSTSSSATSRTVASRYKPGRFGASWIEVVAGPIVDTIYDIYGLERTNVMFQSVCPDLSISDFDETVLAIVHELWAEDFILFNKLDEERKKAGSIQFRV